jgi:hypothetical protein
MGVSFGRTDPDGTVVHGPQWDYPGFNMFRTRLAAAEGIVLDRMAGYHGGRDWSTAATDLEPLLNHADDRGVLTAAQCAQVSVRLRQLVLAMADAYDFAAGMALADLMDDCAVRGADLEFR